MVKNMLDMLHLIHFISHHIHKAFSTYIMAPHNNEMRCYGDETRLIGQFCSGYWDRTLVLYNLRNGHGKFGFNVQHKKGTVAYAKLYCEDRNDDDENEGESENQGQVRNHGKDQNQSADMSLAKFAKYLNMSQEHVIEDAMNGLFTGPGPSDGYRWSDDVSVEDAKASASNPLLIIFTPRRSYRGKFTMHYLDERS